MGGIPIVDNVADALHIIARLQSSTLDYFDDGEVAGIPKVDSAALDYFEYHLSVFQLINDLRGMPLSLQIVEVFEGLEALIRRIPEDMDERVIFGALLARELCHCTNHLETPNLSHEWGLEIFAEAIRCVAQTHPIGREGVQLTIENVIFLTLAETPGSIRQELAQDPRLIVR